MSANIQPLKSPPHKKLKSGGNTKSNNTEPKATTNQKESIMDLSNLEANGNSSSSEEVFHGFDPKDHGIDPRDYPAKILAEEIEEEGFSNQDIAIDSSFDPITIKEELSSKNDHTFAVNLLDSGPDQTVGEETIYVNTTVSNLSSNLASSNNEVMSSPCSSNFVIGTNSYRRKGKYSNTPQHNSSAPILTAETIRDIPTFLVVGGGEGQSCEEGYETSNRSPSETSSVISSTTPIPEVVQVGDFKIKSEEIFNLKLKEEIRKTTNLIAAKNYHRKRKAEMIREDSELYDLEIKNRQLRQQFDSLEAKVEYFKAVYLKKLKNGELSTSKKCQCQIMKSKNVDS